jgi:hypothetical protein
MNIWHSRALSLIISHSTASPRRMLMVDNVMQKMQGGLSSASIVLKSFFSLQHSDHSVSGSNIPESSEDRAGRT